VEIYYECILKLANCLQHQANNNLLTTFFRACLQPYLQMATTRMKRDTLFKQKKIIVTCEENIGNAINTKNCLNHQLSKRRLAKERG